MPVRTIQAKGLAVGDVIHREEEGTMWTRHNPPPPEIFEVVESVEVHDTYVSCVMTPSGRTFVNGHPPEPTLRFHPEALVRVHNREPSRR